MALFDAYDTVPESLIPEGTAHKMILQVSEIVRKEGKIGLKCTFQVVDGQYNGFMIYEYFNVKHPDKLAEYIGNRQLSQFREAIGKLKIATDNPMDFHNIPFVGLVKIQKGRDGYEDQNRIAKYSRCAGGGEIASPPGRAVVDEDDIPF